MYAYREVIDADRRAYAESLESDVGRWFIGTAARAHQTYFEGAVEQIAQDFVDPVTHRPALRPPRAQDPASAAPLRRFPIVPRPHAGSRRGALAPSECPSRSRDLPKGHVPRRS